MTRHSEPNLDRHADLAQHVRVVPLIAVLSALLMTLLLLGGCGGSSSDASDSAVLRLPALRAVADPVHGGRFEDAEGRHVILRGVNVNSFAEYWQGTSYPTTFAFGEDDARRMAEIGWNVVRLLASWSRVEPEPGIYDEAYIGSLSNAVDILAAHGIYSIIDLHQDAWGPTLAARPDEICSTGAAPAFGWDGAPGWATLDGGRARCTTGQREFSPAVIAAFRAFWNNAEGPGGIGIRTRYVRMLGHLAARFAGAEAVVGFDIMNEPNAFNPTDEQGLAALHGEAWEAIRTAQADVPGPGQIVIFEPSAAWSSFRVRPFDFQRDENIAYAPHLYQGGLDGGPLEPQFIDARADAAAFGGAPILTGEWGSGPERAANPNDSYFSEHQRLQDEYLYGATLWTWSESCGDPHKAADYRAGQVPYVWGVFEVDCRTNDIVGVRDELIRALTRGYVRAAPGRLTAMHYDPLTGAASAAGTAAPIGGEVLFFYPASRHGAPTVTTVGLDAVRIEPAPGDNAYITARTTNAEWNLQVTRAGG